MLKFALKHMFTKRARMALVALSVIISATVGLLAYNVSSQINDGIQASAVYYDIIIGPAGSSTQLAMNTMFFTDKPLGTISYDYVDELMATGLVNRAVPMTMGDSYNASRVVGTAAELLEDKALKEGRLFETDELYAAVVGSKVASQYGLEPGDTIITSHGLSSAGTQHAASPYTVIGILETTHTNYDNTVFTSYKTVWAVHGHEEEHGEHEEAEETETPAQTAQERADVMSHTARGTTAQTHAEEDEDEEGHAHEGEVCAILVKTKSPAAYSRITDAYSGNSSLLVINPATVLREVLSQVDTSTQIVYALCAVILVMNILVISVITLLNLIDSKKEITLMRTIGISMKHVGEVYLVQNALLGLVSTLVALVLSHASLALINTYTVGMGIVTNPYRIYPFEWLIALTVFVISVLPTMISISAMARRDVIESR